MKKNSGKKREKPKAASSRSPKSEPKSTAEANRSEPSSSARKLERIGSSSFDPSAASPLSKETAQPQHPQDKVGAKSEQQPDPQKRVPSLAASAVPVATASTLRPEAAQSRTADVPSVSEGVAKTPRTKLPTTGGESSWSLVEQQLQSTAPSKQAKIKPGKRPPRRSQLTKSEIKVPAVLLEGDSPTVLSITGPGARYALAPTPVATRQIGRSGELPEAYGTGRVFLAARDPHWLYVSWDFTREQQNHFNSQSRDGHLVVRVVGRRERDVSVPEIHVHPESRDWFVHVPSAETLYQAEVGFYNATGMWRTVGLSQNTFTPPDAPSTDIAAKFATIPPEISFERVLDAVQQFVTVSKNEPLLSAVAKAAEAQLTEPSSPPERISLVQPELPRSSGTRIGPISDSATIPKSTSKKRHSRSLPVQIRQGNEWSEDQTRALTKLIHIDSFRRVWLGSMEITELVRMQLQEEIASIAAAVAKRVPGGEVPARPVELHISSPAGGEIKKPGKFWFKINAELIIYGATEPDASVTVAERPIKLRPDGTFSFRFSLPDGRYQLPAVAVSSDGQDAREARLEFSRSTEYLGHVEMHPQDALLRSPLGQNIS